MECNTSSLMLLASLLLLVFSFLVNFSKKSPSYKFPPGPRGWPIVGNLFDIGSVPHSTFTGLRHKYGPILWLKFGSTNTMVVQSAEAAAELFKNHDVTFGDRTVPDVTRACDYFQGSVVLAPYGTFWRMLRRLCSMEMFINKRINETVEIRRKPVETMVMQIEKEANSLKKGEGLDVARFLFHASFNLLGNLILSRDVVDQESNKESEFLVVMTRIMDLTGHGNISDIFPCLRWFDLLGLRRNMKHHMGKALEIASGFVKERLKETQSDGKKKNDFLDVLIQFEGKGKDEPNKLSEHEINTFILELFIAGSETTSTTLEWTLTELLRNPEVMEKVKSEISKVIGPNQKFEESDIDNVPYMQAVIKEALRLHPPGPFLIPRKATKDTKFKGYDIPKDTQVFVNAYAIGRDPECWEDPLCFKPERFLGSNIDFKGQNFELIPFGAGRRICIGLPLANRMLHLFLGSLLHEFNWELPHTVTPESIDMTEKMGATMSKLEHLKAIPKRILSK